MTIARTDAARVSTPRLARLYLGFLCFVLAGYAISGRDFAHLGFPPIYIGEVALALGLLTALTTGSLAGAVLNLPGLALALLMVWTALRTAPYWKAYSFDSVRDAMIVFYGLFAYVIASLILQRPVTLMLLLERYKRFIFYMILLSPIIPIAQFIVGPLTLGTQQFVGAKVGDLSCHLTAILALAFLGFVRLRPITITIILLVELFAFTQGREAMVVFIVGCSLASILSPDRTALRRFAILIGTSVVVVCGLAALDIQFARDGSRAVSVRQLVVNTSSIFTHAGSDPVEDTKEWRLNWWTDIINYTVHGRYFWSGKGFGPNLADTDGYQTSDVEAGEAPLRSPHSAHMTILARGGVPGLVLWIAALGAWIVAVVRQLIEAKKLRDQWWVGIFGFLLTYWTMMIIASSFDVALEGPMLGIWFWTIHGIGIAALVLHRHRVAAWHQFRLRSSTLGLSGDHPNAPQVSAPKGGARCGHR